MGANGKDDWTSGGHLPARRDFTKEDVNKRNEEFPSDFALVDIATDPSEETSKTSTLRKECGVVSGAEGRGHSATKPQKPQ
jgi:hypothetical protein